MILFVTKPSTSSLVALNCGEGKYSIYCEASSVGPIKKYGQLTFEFPNDFQGRIFKRREKVIGCLTAHGHPPDWLVVR